MGFSNETSYKRRVVFNTGGFDDSESREQTIPFALEVLQLNLKSNPEKRKIDLIGVNDLTVGVEIEHSKTWIGNYWDKKNYGLCTISKMGYKTVNIPWWRKHIYWTEGLDPNWNRNVYMRWNKDYTCAIVIRPEVILDKNKAIDANFKTYRITTGDIESWKVFKEEDVETYNLINDKWVKNIISK